MDLSARARGCIMIVFVLLILNLCVLRFLSIPTWGRFMSFVSFMFLGAASMGMIRHNEENRETHQWVGGAFVLFSLELTRDLLVGKNTIFSFDVLLHFALAWFLLWLGIELLYSRS